MNRVIFFSLSVFLIMLSRELFSQNSSQPFSSTYEVQKIPSNPDIAQLGKFGDMPVNKYNGTANISIPIYEIDHDGLKIPIALKYNTSGIKVEQEASWVGLGWSLSDGMTITREVNGYEDIYNSNDANARSVGWIYSRDFLFPNPEDNYVSPGQLSEKDLVELQQKKTTDYKVDLEPDFFTVNLPSGACKFTLPKIVGTDTVLTAVTSDSKNFKILYNVVSRVFKVTDPNGFIFDFTVKEMSTGYGSYESNDKYTKKGVVAGIRFPIFQGKQMISSWRVSSIKSPYGRQLNFTYQNGFYFSFPHFEESQEILAGNYPSFLTAWDNVPVYLSQTAEPSPSMSANLSAFNVKNLTLISGDFGSVEFLLSDRSDLVSKADKLALSGFNPLTEPWNTYLDFGDTLIAKKVDKVIVKNKQAEVIKTASLSYSYFNSQWVGIESASMWNSVDPFQCDVSYVRLKLDGIDIDGQKYLFEYIQPNSLPIKCSRSVDFWGFYNGVNNSTKIPSFNRFYVNHPGLSLADEYHEFFIRVNGGNRGADGNYGKIGALQKVIYPTRGYTIFDYEGNKVSMSNITYSPTQFRANGSGQFRFTNLTSSTNYKYSYQYLKLAKTPTYSLYEYNTCKVISASYSVNSSFQVNETTFCNQQNFNTRINATITWTVGAGQGSPVGRAVWIRNVNTGQEYNVFDHNNVQNRTLETTMNLPIGNYQLMSANWTQNSPLSVVTTSASVAVFSTQVPPQILSEEFEVGGLRIKSLTNYGNDGYFISKSNYLYDQYVTENSQQVSNGKLMDELVYHSKAQNLFDYTVVDFSQNANGAGAVLSSDSKIRNSPSASGSHIGYSLVREEKVDSQGNKLGQTVSEFTNKPNEYIMKPTEFLPKIVSGVLSSEDFHTTIDDLRYIPGFDFYPVTYGSVYVLGARPITYDHMNGSLQKERIYDQSGNLLLKETVNMYNSTQVLIYSSSFAGVYFFGNLIVHFQPYQTIARANYLLNMTQQLVSTTTIDYANGIQLINSTNNYYENTAHHLLTRSSTSTSNGNVNTIKYYYPQDVSSVPYMSNLVSANRLVSPIITERYKGTSSNLYLTLLEKVHTIYSNTNSTSGDILPKEVLTYALGDAVGQQRVLYEKYSNYGTLIQYRKSNEDMPVSLIWSYNKLLPIAQIVNAQSDQVAFSSFDEPTISDGGWVLASGNITSLTSKTGTKCLDTGGTIAKNGLPNSNYVVGFWAKTNSGSSGSVTVNGTPISITDSNWKYYEITKAGTSVTLSNSNVYVDELRLYPVGAQMTSYTYKPLVGMTSQNDAKGRVQNFEYDVAGRLIRIKDGEGNIVKQYDYRYKNQ
jgi:YD repeat-containing protein